MSEPEPIDRNESYRREDYATDLRHTDLESSVEGQPAGSERAKNEREAGPRVVGSALPAGSPLSAGRPLSGHGEGQAFRSVPPVGRALSAPIAPETDQHSGISQTIGSILQSMPFLQRLLPLLDGSIASAVSSLMTPHTQAQAPAPKVDLAPLESSLSELQTQQRDLRSQMMDQNGSLKRVEDQLEMVREATDRNTLEQQELIEDLKALGGKVNLFALLLVGLLIGSLLLNVMLFLHIQRVLP